MPIPSQDQLVDYLESTAQQPVSKQTDLTQIANQVQPLESPFKTGMLTSRKAREITRRNLRDLQSLTGENLNIMV